MSGPVLSRERYAALYGPTVGDRIRLADTDLLIEIEEDLSRAGPAWPATRRSSVAGMVIRESMGQSRLTAAQGAPDMVITGGDRVGPTGASSRPTWHHERSDRRAGQGGQPRHDWTACTRTW